MPIGNAQPPTCLEFAQDGDRLYVEGDGYMKQYNLSIPYNLNSMTETGSISGWAAHGPGDPAFSPDGLKVVIGMRQAHEIRGGTLTSQHTHKHMYIIHLMVIHHVVNGMRQVLHYM